MRDRAQRVELPDGTVVWARVSRLDTGGRDYDDRYENVGAWDRVTAQVEGMRELVGGIAASVRGAAAGLAPDEVSVSFGIELAAKPGKAVALLADGEAKANLSVTLTWQPGRETGVPAPRAPETSGDTDAPAAGAGGSGR